MAEIEGSKITDITGGSELDKMDARAKAAVVVVSLGADRASQIYKYLSEQEIEDLTYEVAKLGKTNNAQVENHDKRMNDCLPPILFSAIFKLLKVLPDTELDAC